jgi:carboxymethylenebutenolidase
MPGKMIDIKAADGRTFQGFMATPDSDSGAGVIVLQEIFGINYFMRETCHRLAAQGYVALCPDLFWRQEPGVELSDMTEAEWGRAFGFYQGFDMDNGVADAGAALEQLRASPECSGKVGAVGYCLGGMLAYLMATRTSADASVGYYGVGIQDALSEAENISTPHMMHIAELDKFCPPEAQSAISDGLTNNTAVTIHSYTNVDHAFARTGGEHFDALAASTANTRTSEFFAEHLA